MIVILAALGWSLFVLAVLVSELERRYYKTQIEQKDNVIALWRAEAASRARIISRLRNNCEDL